MTGKQVTMHETSGNETKLYVGDYPSGMYILKIYTQQSVGVLRFIKQCLRVFVLTYQTDSMRLILSCLRPSCS
ncbi:MAG: T9SS type A sorting domain-containing protein [Cytophagales bacterium]